MNSVARSSIFRLLITCVVICAFSACGNDEPGEVPAEQENTATSVEVPGVPLLSPQESAAAAALPAGYALQPVVFEPAVEEPVLIAWDADGAAYVAEMRSYMQDIDGKGQMQPVSRIVRFTDDDGDGTWENRTIFADELVLPRALLPLDDRLLIRETDSPQILSLRDTDGDGVADEREVVFEYPETDRRNLEHQDANLLWNLDNWIYSCQGGARLRIGSDGTISSAPLVSELNQWGLTQDDTGQLFYADNSMPARDFQQPFHYWNLLKNDLITAPERQLLGPNIQPEFLEVFPLIAADDAQGVPEELRDDGTLKRFSCACGQHIYRGNALPELTGNYFICEPVGRLIRRAKIRQHLGQRILENPHEQSEFLRSRDYLFRPVHLDTGPDGHLYIVDMNRGIIQESAWVVEGSSIRTVIEEKKLALAKRRGRIFRVVKEGAKTAFTRPQLLRAPTGDLVGHLNHPNGWWRDTAQRLLVLRRDRKAVAPLKAMLRNGSTPLGRLHSLWTLSGLDALEKDDLLNALKDPDDRVREAAVRNAEPWLARADETVYGALEKLVNDPSPKVIQQTLLSLAAGPERLSHPLADRLIRRHLWIPVVRMAAITAFQKAPLPVFKEMFVEGFFKKACAATPRAGSYKRIRNEWVFSLQYRFAAQRSVSRFRALDAEGEKSLHRGQMIFKQNCIQCHGADATGAVHQGEQMGADLKHSDRVLSNPAGAVRIILNGLKGEVDGKEIGVMIPYASQDDAFIADILSSLRWPLRRSRITPEFVAQQRALNEGRQAAWTLEELGHLAPSRLQPQDSWAAESNCGDHLVRMFDNNLLSRFHSKGDQKPGMSIIVNWKEPHELSYVVLDSGDSKQGYARGLEIHVADGDGPWVKAGELDGADDQVQELALEPRRATRVRIRLTQGASVPWSVHELLFYGLPADR